MFEYTMEATALWCLALPAIMVTAVIYGITKTIIDYFKGEYDD